jgi:hypothetical protein
MMDAQTVPGTDTDPDHNVLVPKIYTKLKKTINFQKGGKIQARIWSSYRFNDSKCKVFWKKNLVLL